MLSFAFSNPTSRNKGDRFYYLQSRYYNPTASRFLNADAFASTGQGLLGNNMFAYCNNNPTACADYDGKRTGHARAIAEMKREAAEEKYNSETIHVFVEGEGVPVEGKLNVMLRPTENVIQIINSCQITDTYEMYAVLNTVMSDPLYDADVYVTNKEQAVIEWQAHNMIHVLTETFPGTEELLSKYGYPDSNNRTISVDLNRTLDRKEKALYNAAAFIYLFMS